ncbi:DUF3298 domain-containing protein [Aliibacillus thermotolerans]|nr:DUF3298 domain-containing protein [Aliibacillus thermotolerans]
MYKSPFLWRTLKAMRQKKGVIFMTKTVRKGKIILSTFLFLFAILFSTEGVSGKEADIQLKETEFDDIQLLQWQKNDELYEMNIQLPIFTTDALNAQMKKYMEEQITAFLEAIDGHVTSKRPGNLYITVDILKSGIGLYSLVFSEQIYTGGANWNDTNTVLLADVEKDQFMQQANLFQDVVKAREIIRPLVVEELKKDENLDGYLLEDQIEKWLRDPDYQFQNMYIDCANKRLGFIFDKYEVAAGVVGMPQVYLPLDEKLFSLFKDTWQERMQQCQK